MRAFLHGIRRVDMKSERGDPVSGFSIFFSYPSPGVTGEETDRRFIFDEVATDSAWHPEVGKQINIDFSPKGKVLAISTVHEK